MAQPPLALPQSTWLPEAGSLHPPPVLKFLRVLPTPQLCSPGLLLTACYTHCTRSPPGFQTLVFRNLLILRFPDARAPQGKWSGVYLQTANPAVYCFNNLLEEA